MTIPQATAVSNGIHPSCKILINILFISLLFNFEIQFPILPCPYVKFTTGQVDVF